MKHTMAASSRRDSETEEVIDHGEETKGQEVIFTRIEIQITGMIKGVGEITMEAEDTERETEIAIMRTTLMGREVKAEERGEMDISIHQK